MTTIRTELQQKAQSAIMQYAIFRWESAALLAVTIVLTFLLRRPFPWWPPWGWPVLGLLGLLLIVYSSLNDAETNAEMLVSVFQEQFTVSRLRDKALQQQMTNALEYQRRIEMQVRRQRPGLIRDRLESTANQITDWLSNIYQLALRLDAYRNDDLLARERSLLPKELENLATRRLRETNPMMQGQLDEVIAGKTQHQATLRELDTRMQQAALQMEQSLTALATLYSQVQLIDAQAVDSGRAERLQADIHEQVNRLNDLVASINEVYDYHTKGLDNG
jgi:hypothetical protein